MDATIEIRWTGPPEQSCKLLAAHGYPAECDPDTVYELPRDVALGLAASTRGWQLDPDDVAPDPATQTVKWLDAHYGHVDDYPTKSKRAEKVAFVAALTNDDDSPGA